MLLLRNSLLFLAILAYGEMVIKKAYYLSESKIYIFTASVMLEGKTNTEKTKLYFINP